MVAVMIHFSLQMHRDQLVDTDKKPKGFHMNAGILVADLTIWVATYVLFFYEWDKP